MKLLIKYSIYTCMILSIMSCQKDDFANTYENQGAIIKASFSKSTDTKTILNTTNNTALWSEGDQIKLYDGINENETTITLASSGEPSTTTGIITDGGEAFAFKKISSWGNTLYAVYPASAAAGVTDGGNVKITIPNETDGTFANANICAATTTTNLLQFKNATAIVEIKDKMTSITKMELNATNISGTYPVDLSGANAVLGSIIGTGNNVVTITPSETNEGPYYAAVAPVSFSGQIATYYEGETPVGTKTINEQKLLAENTIYNIHHANRGGNGVFTVSSTNKVQFSPGNLWYGKKGSESASFHFEANQWEFQSTYSNTWGDNNHISHFYWYNYSNRIKSYGETYVNPSGTPSSNDIFFTNATEHTPNSNFTVEGQTGIWRCLSSGLGDFTEGWYYLLQCRTCSTLGISAGTNVRYAYVIVNNVKGMLLFPDTFTWNPSTMGTAPSKVNSPSSDWNVKDYSTTEFSAIEKAGCVFLPAIGYRNGSTIYTENEVTGYWHPKGSTEIHATCTGIESGGLVPIASYKRSDATAIRLVQNLN